MKKFFLIAIFLSIPMISYASTYVPCAEDEEGTCWPCGETCSARLTYQSKADKDAKKNATLTYSGYDEANKVTGTKNSVGIRYK